MTNIKHVNSIVDRDFRNRINQLIDSVNSIGTSLNDLVVKGVMTTDQYSNLIAAINGLVKIGEVSIDTLNDELKNELEKINNKIDKNNISVYDINKNLGKLDQTFLSDELLQQISGTAPINAVPADKSITRAKVAEKAVGPSETSFVKLGKNKFDGVYVKGHPSGENQAKWNDSEAISAIIPVENNTMYAISKSPTTDRFRIYSSKNYPKDGDSISQRFIIDSQSSVIVDSIDDNYLIIQLSSVSQKKTPDWFQVEVGETVTEYEPPKVTIDLEKESINTVSLKGISRTGLLIGAPRNFVVDLLAQKIKVSGSNVFIVSGGDRYNLSEGEWSYADLISNMLGVIVVYDTNTNSIKFIRSTEKEKMKKNNNIIIGNIRDDAYDTDCFFYGIYSVVGKKDNNDERMVGDHLFVANSYMEINEERSVPDNEDITVDYINGIFDSLANDFPNYVTKSVLGSASDGQDINIYEFTPPSPMNTVSEYEQYPKIFVEGGIHGHEWGSVLTVARFFDNLCRNWRDNEGFKRMRAGVHFVVIPILNTYGRDYSAGGGGGISARKNANRVDLNSNFPSGWVYNGDVTSPTTSGDEPLSEPESQLVYNYMMDNKDIKYMIDVHNFGSYPREESSYVLWMASHNKQVMKMLRGVGSRVVTELKSNHESLDDETSSILSLYRPKTGGAVHEWYVAGGIFSTLLELPYEVEIDGAGDKKILANKLSQEALGNLILGILDKYHYLQ